MTRGSLRSALFIVFAITAGLAQAEIFYTLEVKSPETLVVSMSFDPKGKEVLLQRPKWAPGGYEYGDPPAPANMTASGGILVKESDNTWKVSGITGKQVTVSYTLPIESGDLIPVASPLPNEDSYLIGNAYTYLYVVGRKTEHCTLKINKPADWKVALGLDAVAGKADTYKAHDFDTLIDNPISLGDLWIDTYEVLGRKHEIVLRGGDRVLVDREKLKTICKSLTEIQADFFRSLPYNKYVWHFKIFDGVDGGGGVEHLNSTTIMLASGVGPAAVSLLSHEFLHLYNVKRIRSKPLGPFDYNVLPKTGAIWWLEGVTDYYSALWLPTYGFSWNRANWYNYVAANWRQVITDPDHTEVSADDSSRRVSEAENGRGNHEGYRISYYTVGFLAGLCLDLEIRYRTSNAKSLDDVMLALWEQCKDNKPGFAEDEIRRQCVKFGGSGMGDFYDRIVLKPGPMPVKEQLAKFGLLLSEEDQSFNDVGFAWTASRADKGVKVGAVRFASELQKDDVLLALNGVAVDKATGGEITVAMRAAVASLVVGTAAKARVRRGSSELDVSFVPASGSRKVWKVTESSGADTAAGKLREGWLMGRKVDLAGVRVGEKGRG